MTYLIRHFYKYRGLVKWYDRGLQNLWWEFDSLIPCSKNTVNSVFFLCHVVFHVICKGGITIRAFYIFLQIVNWIAL